LLPLIGRSAPPKGLSQFSSKNSVKQLKLLREVLALIRDFTGSPEFCSVHGLSRLVLRLRRKAIGRIFCDKMGIGKTLRLIGGLAFVILAGCTRDAGTNSSTSSQSTNTAEATNRRVFEVRGVIQELRPDQKEVVIRHEEIPNYMAAMTMPFEVKNANELTGLRTNDQVSFTMIVTERDGWIEGITRIGSDTNTPASTERPRMRLVRDVEPLEVGDPIPDYTFTNSLGQKLSLAGLKGQAFAFTFIFTRCPFPTFCPRMNSNFSDAYKQLTAMTNGPTNWHLISISFDPDFDTPERLKGYSAMYHSDPKKWDWVTGAMIDIDAITEQVGLVFAYEKGTFNHNLRTVVVDKDGRLRKKFQGNEWKPEELVEEIIAGAEGRPIPKD
jgi:protein SCO1